MTDTPFPLVLSMTDVSNYLRCRKLFQFSAIDGLNPVKRNEAVENGLNFHEIVAHKARTGEWPQTDSPMLEIAVAYDAKYPIPRTGADPTRESAVYAERPFFVQPVPDLNVWARFTGDRITVSTRTVGILDYKTFSKAPTLDPDIDFQAKTYLTLAKLRWPGRDVYEFRWDHVRSELGRFLKNKGEAVWTPWEEHERYLVNSMILEEHEARLFEKELADVLRDIEATMQHQRFYRTALKGNSPYTCGSCFYKSLCAQDAANGGHLTTDDIDRLTEPERGRYHYDDVTQDPRVRYYVDRGVSVDKAVRDVYGPLLIA